jgi:hypothetical protein
LINDVPTKLHAKKEKKLLKRFSEIGTFKEKLTLTLTDGRTDGRTTDKSVLEKLRCQMAQRS